MMVAPLFPRTALISKEFREARLTLVLVFAALLATYSATLAPSVTLWDAGEFQAAIASLGIPHPPGTPLYIIIGNAWAKVFGILPLALALNLFSAVVTAIGCALLAGWVTRWTRDPIAGIAAGLSSGTMLAVWQNATETEIYALSMLLAVLMVLAGERAGATGSAKWRLLLAYLMALAVPIQISALVAAPAAILLAAMPAEGPTDWRKAVALGGAFVMAAGAGVASPGVMFAGLAVLAVTTFRGSPGSGREAIASATVVLLGLTPILFMLVRAAHDPLVNQGNPSTIADLVDVVARNQYPLPGLWPRQAPLWVQLLPLVQYGDWQFASGLDPSVAASWRRTPFSIAALLLAVAGWRHLYRSNRRFAAGAGLLLVMSSLGVVGILNLRATPSILDSVLPAGATHEPRERDYFFALAFATAGLLVGTGAVATTRRWLPSAPRTSATIAIGMAALPLVLNWRAANRRPEGQLANALGESLLASVPQRAVLLVAGDNDSYTTWYRQAVGDRRDVVPVTISLLPAHWYRQELARRYELLAPAEVEAWRGDREILRALANGAQRTGRPLAAAVSVSASVRQSLAPAWTLGGTAYVADFSAAPRGDVVDPAAVKRIAALVAPQLPRSEHRGRDPAVPYVVRLLRCPIDAAAHGQNTGQPGSLDSRCNFK
jgi:hypothetical protein